MVLILSMQKIKIQKMRQGLNQKKLSGCYDESIKKGELCLIL